MSFLLTTRSKFLNPSFYLYFNSYFNSSVNNETFISGTSASYLEDMYRLWKLDPKQVHASWDVYFSGVESGRSVGSAYVSPPSMSLSLPSTASPTLSTSVGDALDEDTIREYLELQSVIQSFRIRGHLAATLDPLNIVRSEHTKSSRIQKYVLRHYKLPKDLNKKYMLHNTDYISGGEKSLSVSEILKRLEIAYCGNVGVEYMHVGNQEKYEFIRHKFETPGSIRSLSPYEKRLILKRLIRASGFESYLATKYPSEKRFGLEGGEVLIPAVKTMIDTASSLGVDIFNIGIAHRGRLNLLANVIRKPLQDLFAQFLLVSVEDDEEFRGDVKYHLGTYMERVNSETKRPIVVCVAANPSHLESINPVVVGKTNAERMLIGDKDGNKVWSILIHGDAATTGQGVVYETFHLSELPCFTNQGSIHIIINNQIGFTTDPRVSRTSEYCTEVAKVSSAPVFHVNGDDPEAVCYVMKAATEYKHKFKSDVVVDIVCYRRHGHNEADQPMFTQPHMYKIIQKLKPVSVKYAEELLKQRVVDSEDVKRMEEITYNWLRNGFEKAKTVKVKTRDWLDSPWKNFFTVDKDPLDIPATSVHKDILLKIGEAVSTPPPNFEIHPGLVRILKSRRDMISANSLDWALGEAFAIGSLLEEGFNVRLTGQDVERGTFSHRHHIYHHQSEDQVTYTPLHSLFPGGGTYTVCNSSLSEFGVLGFELGYSMVSPYNLVMWEAQFGDFSNSCQIIMDQFLSSGEAKWVRQTGLVTLLPHGLEGQGPEHSSARPERYLQMCAESEPLTDSMPEQLYKANWFIANPTTPANLFHLLRRQLKLNYRKPLVLFTPKSLLRHPEARSSLEEFAGDSMFKPYISDESIGSPELVEKVILCCGKVFYDLKQERSKRGLDGKVTICRIEQLFPFPYSDLRKDMSQYPRAEVFWAQEEHKNQGWWDFVHPRVTQLLNRPLEYRGRPAAATPSCGSKKIHDKEHFDFMNKCFS